MTLRDGMTDHTRWPFRGRAALASSDFSVAGETLRTACQSTVPDMRPQSSLTAACSNRRSNTKPGLRRAGPSGLPGATRGD